MERRQTRRSAALLYQRFSLQVLLDGLSRGRIEEERPHAMAVIVKVERGKQGPSFFIEGLVTDPPQLPIIFHEAQDRALVGQGMVDIIGFRE